MSLRFNSHPRIQKGSGIGGIFSSVRRFFTSPFVKKIITSPLAKSIGKRSLVSGAEILSSPNKKKKLNSELENIREKANRIGQKTLTKILEQELSSSESEEEKKITKRKKAKKKKKNQLSGKAKKIKKNNDLLDSE